MDEHSPETATIVALALFLVAYIVWLVRNTVKSRIDLYDLILLSTVALIPSAFVFFSPLAYKISRFLGVAFPFVILYGGLFFLVFLGLYRIIKRINSLVLRNIRLVQELALLRNELTKLEKNLEIPKSS